VNFQPINQFGEVQPIGGVNEKIEGFFRVCKELDTVEGKGVLIPASNAEDLVLCKEVEDAILVGKFKLYTMETVEDGLKVLLDHKDITLEKVIKVMERESKKYIEKPKMSKIPQLPVEKKVEVNEEKPTQNKCTTRYKSKL